MKRARREGEWRAWIEANGRKIGSGKEATVYALDGSAFKVFGPRASQDAKQRNVDFLSEHVDSRVVPKIGTVVCVEEGIIEMELLDAAVDNKLGYVTVKHFKTMEAFKDKLCRSRLLDIIWWSRLRLPHDVEFTDFKNIENIMVRLNDYGWPVQAMFLEGGTTKKNTAK